MDFTFKELYKSDIANKYNIDNRPQTDEVVTNLLRLVVELLQPLRTYINHPIYISSGYRSKVINDLVKGVWNSQHCIGQAVDIYCKQKTVKELMAIILMLGLPFDQMINEKDNWLHISLRETNNRKEIIDNGKSKEN